MSDYNLFSQHMSDFCRYSTHFIIFIPRLVTTGFLRSRSTVLAFWSLLGPDWFAVLPKKAIGPRPDQTLKHYKHLEIHTRVGDPPVSMLPVPVDPPSSLIFVFVFADFVLLQFFRHNHNQEKKLILLCCISLPVSQPSVMVHFFL